MHQPNPIDIAAKASGEPAFREVGVGPWGQTHPGEPRPDDPQSPNYDRRFDTVLLDEATVVTCLTGTATGRFRPLKMILTIMVGMIRSCRGKLDARFQYRIHGAHCQRIPSETCTYRRTAQVESQGRADDGTVPARRKPPVHSRACRMLEAAHCRRNRRSPIASGRNRIPHARKCKKSELCLHERGGFVS